MTGLPGEGPLVQNLPTKPLGGQALNLWNIAALLAMAASAWPAAAQNLRCRNDFAERGDSKLSVLSKCGEPVLKDHFCRPDPNPPDAKGRVPPCTPVELWSYRPGSGQFITILEFQEGTLRSIQYGDRIN